MPKGLDKILIKSSSTDFEKRVHKLRSNIMHEAMFAGDGTEENQIVADILSDVSRRGDKAVTEYTEKFDGVKLSPEHFRIGSDEMEKAYRQIDSGLLTCLREAIENVRIYQKDILIDTENQPRGIKYTPIKRAGICVPGASAPLPSTVIMTAVPAQVAGVEEIVVVSPPRCEGSIHPVILAVCYELEIREVYRIGGVQAVGAMAFGTKTIGKVDKIVGPGNKWVQAAKKHVAGDYVGIDSVAGPSEVLIIANEQASPAYIAADMLSQAEHAADSSAIVLTDSKGLSKSILSELSKQLSQLDRAAEAKKSLQKFSAVIVTDSLDQAVEMANDFACEHLEIQCGRDSSAVAEKITNAGAIFIGPYTPVAVGDYWAGPSHTLPTGSRAKFASALTCNDFLKSISIIEFDQEMLAESAAEIIRLAQTEGLDAHANSIKIRQQD